jgi:HAD superfamily hydrolase (TIGR01509 family)
VLSRSVYKADYEFSIGSPVLWREGSEEGPFLEWWKVCLAATDIEIPDNMLIEITSRGKEWVKGANWVLYDDVMPTVKGLKEKGMLLGVVSTLRFDKAGLSPYLDVTVTPQEAGCNKPDPEMFLFAARRLALEPKDVIYIGDQYERDILGSMRAGIKSWLIDRYDLVKESTDFPVIRSVSEVIDLV